jgi:hypothetical protein
MKIDWQQIAAEIGGLDSDGEECGVGTVGGRRALEIILGEQNIREAVDWFADDKPGAFTAEMVLRIISSTIAMERCHEIYKAEPGSRRAGAAVFLLYETADHRVLPWIPEFLKDSEMAIRWNGVMALGKVLSGPLGDEGVAMAKALLISAESDADPGVRERATEIRRRLASNPKHQQLQL